ncbi:NAD-dependent epimerase/dehydratase family protein [Paenibacillus sp. 2TAB26]|uniref:NAD-dependent epimerase/dehydratase family protein n=1 Tax=Paenibacillus sp. 2TAB26 TaxID=3233005 RepID=UPI003F9B88BB
MRVAVTGGCGFIGSHLVDSLIENGHEVLVIDNLSTGILENLNRDALFVHTDITSELSKEALNNFQPEVVYHHAAQVSVMQSMNDPLADANCNIINTLTLLEHCKKANVKKIVYASSAAVYGNPQYLPINEEHIQLPISYYGISKYTPEHYIRVFCANNKMKFTILRYANVYGDRQDGKGEGGVVSVFLEALNSGCGITIHGTGKQSRDFIFVKDIVSANLTVLNQGHDQIFNVSTGQPTSINELFEIITKYLNINISPEYISGREGDIDHSYLDNTMITSATTWRSLFTLEQGINYIINKSNATRKVAK